METEGTLSKEFAEREADVKVHRLSYTLLDLQTHRVFEMEEVSLAQALEELQARQVAAAALRAFKNMTKPAGSRAGWEASPFYLFLLPVTCYLPVILVHSMVWHVYSIANSV